MNIDKNFLISKLKGYRASHRNRWQFIKEGALSFHAFLLFEFYLDIMDFDPGHKNKYGSFEYIPEEIGQIFNRTTETIRGWHAELKRKKLVACLDDKRNLWKIFNPQRYITNSNLKGRAHKFVKEEKNNGLEKIIKNTSFSPKETEEIIKNKEKIRANKQKIPKNKDAIAISSSKVESRLNNDITRILKVLHPEDQKKVQRLKDLKWEINCLEIYGELLIKKRKGILTKGDKKALNTIENDPAYEEYIPMEETSLSEEDQRWILTQNFTMPD